MRVSGKAGVMIVLAAGCLGFLVALAGSPGIPRPRGDADQVSVSVFVVDRQAETPE